MDKNSRTYKTIQNAKVNLLFTILSFFIAFFSRKIFINTLGVEFVGLTSTLQSVLGFLNLAELGVGTAIGVALFKPLRQNNETEINEIMSLMASLYRRIGIFVSIGGFILSIFLPYIFSKTQCSYGIVYFCYYAFLISSLLTYFINYKQILLSADQRNYVVTKYLQISNITKLLIQMYCAYQWGNAYIWILIELIFSVPYCIILNYKIHKTYPWLRTDACKYIEATKKYPTIAKYVKQLFIQKIATFSQGQVTPFLIYTFVSLSSVTYYTNYITITSKLSLILNAILGSTEASIGNLIAEGDKRKVLNIYKQMFSIRFFFAGFFVFMLYFLIEPFITLWLGPQYIIGQDILILILADVFISHFRGVTDQFLYGYGLFKDTWAAIAQTVIFISTAIILGIQLGLSGILLASLISKFIIVVLWKPFFLFHQGFKQSCIAYWRLFFINAVIISITFYVEVIITTSHPILVTSYINWIFMALILTLMFIFISGSLMYLFAPGFKDVISRFKFLNKR